MLSRASVKTKNFYEILEIGINSSEEDIKKAFRHKALLFHPDKNKDPKAKGEFQELKKAYETLINKDKKRVYDAILTPQESISHGQNLRTSLKVSLYDFINQIPQNFSTKRKIHCPSCNGTGSSVKKTKKCNFCDGTGLQGLSLVLGQKKKCKYCNGSGFKSQGDPCPKCCGSLFVFEIVKHKITVDPFSKSIILPQMGNFPAGKGLPGDLVVEIEIESHPIYKIDGLNIDRVLEISPSQAILGDEIDLDIFGRALKIKIPQGIQNDQVIEIANEGIKHENQNGLFKAHIKIVIPSLITAEETDLYNRILSLEKGNISWPKVLTL